MPARPAHLSSQWWPHFVQLRVLFCHPADGGNLPSNWCSKLCSCVLSCQPLRRGNIPSNWCSKLCSCVLSCPPRHQTLSSCRKRQSARNKRKEPLVPSHWGEKVSFCTFCATNIPAKSPRPCTYLPAQRSPQNKIFSAYV